ncbi:E3 CR1-alpha CD5 [Baboon adenovirus 3]|uniref:E3 CR1-alpha CD5 n=1 Tax=Simian mastadenovirus C TaxID=1962300 RepID=M9YVE5_9ADEN|nr:E3 CR1-alpha CD5 [Baboon adenovirus 3]AGK27146.1 E3 CR1-alpha CD5 [Baboon adenovirus 3]AGK27218.1 E3 CR1-alpha CD5 [Simian mastadenovirus C]
MKAFVVVFALSLIYSRGTADDLVFEGTIETVLFSDSTSSITLNCSCTNELIQWNANRTFCKAFYRNFTYYSNNSLCAVCTRQALHLYPPFVAGSYLCIGSGAQPCFHRWYLYEDNTSFTTSTPKQVSYLHVSLKPLFALAAFILVILANFILINNLP